MAEIEAKKTDVGEGDGKGQGGASLPAKGWGMKRIAFAVIGVLVYALVGWVAPCPEVLVESSEAVGATTHAAMIGLGSMLFAIIWWVGGVCANWITALLMVTSWPLFGATTIPAAFQPFSETTVWLLIGGFSIAGAVTKTGLLRRIAFNMMRLFPATFEGQTLAFMVAGTVCSPLVPSSTAKGVLGSSIALASSDAMGFAPKSRQRAGVFLSAWYGFGCAAPAFLSASALSYITKGFLPEDVQAQITWGSWFIAMIPWLVIFFVLMYLGNLFLYRPKEKVKISKEYIGSEIEKMGKMSRQEIITAVDLCVCLVLWVLEAQVGINATVTALLGGLVCYILGILSPKDLGKVIPWGTVIFIGSVLSLGNRFTDLGLGTFIGNFFSPIFASMNSLVIIIPVMCVMIYIVRFFIAAQPVVISMFLGIMTPVVSALGMNVFVLALTIYAAVNVFFVTFQNPVYAASFGAMNGTVEAKDCMLGAVLYSAVTIVASLASLPFWSLLGYFG